MTKLTLYAIRQEVELVNSVAPGTRVGFEETSSVSVVEYRCS